MTDGGVGPPIPVGTDDGWFWSGPERKKTDLEKTIEGRGGTKWPHLPTTKTAQQYMDTWNRQTPRGQLGFPKTRDEL
jgi:hypothetical protein